MKRSTALVAIAALLFLASLAMTIRSSFASDAAAQDETQPKIAEAVTSPAGVAAAAPTVFSYQGQLTSAAGTPVTNAALPMTFRLFTALTGGAACWTESQNVNVQNGQFTALLGQTTAIPANCVNSNAFLELAVNGETMSPREMLTAVTAAAKANTLVSDARTLGSFTVDGAMSVVGNLYAESNVTSPSWKDLTIDAGWGTANSVVIGDRVKILGDLTVVGPDISLSYLPRGDGGRAMVHEHGDTLTLNYDNDFSGGTRIGSSLAVAGNLNLQGTCNRTGSGSSSSGQANDCTPGSIVSGAYIEANLMTEEERAAETVERFEQGDLLCWSAEDRQLEKCTTPNDPLVMGAADVNGKPIVLGAEPVKVIGSVKAGDILVASDVPGYAMVNNNPKPGTAIGQALEDSAGDEGLILVMIRKM